METRNSWGMVVLAGLFAIGAVGVASMTYFSELRSEPATVTPTLVTSNGKEDTDGDGLADWQETLLGTDPKKTDTDGDGVSDKEETAMGSNPLKAGVSTSSINYRAPAGLSTTEALSRELYTEYTRLTVNGSFTATERDQIFADVAKRNIEIPNLTQKVTLANLHIKADTPIENYTALATVILREAAKVKEYELATFARTINEEKFSGTPALIETATLYANIAKALLAMNVPPKLADKHLAVVKSIGELSMAVSLMGHWKGDPLDALSYMDAFNRAEAGSQKSISALFSLAASLLKKL